MIPSPNFQSRGGATVRLLVVHTTENNADITPASNIANYFANPSSQVSAHVVIDDNNTIQCVDYSQAAWTVAAFNTVSDNAEMVGEAAYTAADWARHAGTIARAADWLRERSAARGIPLNYLSAADVAAGRSGWTSHLNLGSAGGGHHDPGQAAVDLITAALKESDDMSDLDTPISRPGRQPITLRQFLASADDVTDATRNGDTNAHAALSKQIADLAAVVAKIAGTQATGNVDLDALAAKLAPKLKGPIVAELAERLAADPNPGD